MAKGAPTEAAGRKPRCPSTRTRFGGRLSVCAYRTAAEPAKTRQLAAASGGAYTTPPHSRHVQVVCPPTQLHGWCPTSALPGSSRWPHVI